MAIEADDEILTAFHEVVNMTASALGAWLETDESQAVGQKTSDDAESTGHESGRHIVRILEKKRSAYTEADLAHMHKVVSYVKRHLGQRPAGDTEHTRWAYSLKNWGHDPSRR